MDTITKEWMVRCNEYADKAEKDFSILNEMTDSELAYLVYWNWGYSGAGNVPVTNAAIKVLVARGTDYNALGEQIEKYFEENSYLLD